MFGALDNPANEKLLDMNLREVVTLAPLIVLVFWIGIYPAPFFDALDEPVEKLVRAIQPDFYDVETLDARQAAPTPIPVAELADPVIAGELVDGENN